MQPALRQISEEYLLVAAWKKAHDYIRRHNWYADVLELDLTNANLGETISAISRELASEEPIASDPIRLVLAPKSQQWELKKNKWTNVDNLATKLRPLAHLTVRDQTIATAFMMLMANVAETRQGDPRQSTIDAHKSGMVSYGHRLFCDNTDQKLQFRWGNATIYRQYFQDYQCFVKRPREIISNYFGEDDDSWAVVTADLSQFYDRVRPELLHSAVERMLGNKSDKQFIDKFKSFFNWSWLPDDASAAAKYAIRSKPDPITEFEHIALPQGLVVSGFFANVVLLDFDAAVVDQFERPQEEGWSIVDYCRYVDDMRFVIRLSDEIKSKKPSEQESLIKQHIGDLLSGLLSNHANGLISKPEKLAVVLGTNVSGGTVQFATVMDRINRNASGVMDAAIGEETLDLIEGLLHSTRTKPLVLGDRFQGTVLDKQPDIREETVARFAAHRFRIAFRTLRPMTEPASIEKKEPQVDEPDSDDAPWIGTTNTAPGITRKDLDHKAYYFASQLIERWVLDPSNMRLLRVALDINPNPETLALVVELLSDIVFAKGRESEKKLVACYCAAELLKAGATETGLVDDPDKLPEASDLVDYQTKLGEFATRVVGSNTRFPWYLLQQAHLFLACFDKQSHPTTNVKDPQIESHIILRNVVSGDYSPVPDSQVPSFAFVHMQIHGIDDAARCFLNRWRHADSPWKSRWLNTIVLEQPAFAEYLWNLLDSSEKRDWKHLFLQFGNGDSTNLTDLTAFDSQLQYSLLDVARSHANPFKQEYLLLHFALKLLKQKILGSQLLITPQRVTIRARDWTGLDSRNFPIDDDLFTVELSAQNHEDPRFQVPDWIEPNSRWKYQLGMLLRVLLTGQPDYTRSIGSRVAWTRIKYKPYRSSWLRRRYGMFNGRESFGPPWLPITSWTGDLLTALLQWPGFPRYDSDFPASFTESQLEKLLTQRIELLKRMYGKASKLSLLPTRHTKLTSGSSSPNNGSTTRTSMRVAIAQSVIPRQTDFQHDPTLDDPSYRRRHRRHLASVFAGVEKMLQVRATHVEHAPGIDLLVLPELSLHRSDIFSLVLPFVRRNHCMVCCGLVFHELNPGDENLINVAAWVLPVLQPTGTLDIQLIYQGKCNLTKEEKDLGISSFRPAQWIFEILDTASGNKLWAMSSAVCYDATDLALAADLRDHTEMFVVPALNKDVGTFDNMAAALHYHMFQHVVVANSGEFGGSSAHAPFKESHKRTVFHVHGNEQVAIGFFELDLTLYRQNHTSLKTPPAGLKR
ncbi:MAG: RNA-directed DNA polymerase [Pirellulaceae bacterium]|nr:RNA-directed DNA polymerase [Pirellulaceae bacterium]